MFDLMVEALEMLGSETSDGATHRAVNIFAWGVVVDATAWGVAVDATA